MIMLLSIQISGEEGGSKQVKKDRKKGKRQCDRVMQDEKMSLMEEAHSGRERGQDLKDRRTRSCQEGRGTDSMSRERKKKAT